MSLLPVELRRMIVTPIGWERAASTTDAKGKKTYTREGDVLAKMQSEIVNVIASTGEEVVSHAQLFFDGDPGIRETDRLTLPDGSAPVIWAVLAERDDRGRVLYTTVYLGATSTA